MEQTETLTRSQKKKARAQQKQQSNGIRLQKIAPLTAAQTKFFNCYDDHGVITLHGCPGTGKSFLALYKALEQINKDPETTHVKIIRSNVSVRDVGFLPGNIKDKMAGFEAPYAAICSELYGRGDAYEILKNRKQIEFLPTSHMRGVTFNDCVVVVDECQNMSLQELHTIITRFGKNCKMVLCGDVNQDDFTSERYKQISGYNDMLKILAKIGDAVQNIEFTVNDIVRSGFVRDYIIAKMEYEAVKPSNISWLNGLEKSADLNDINVGC